jgi:hypothetical protein
MPVGARIFGARTDGLLRSRQGSRALVPRARALALGRGQRGGWRTGLRAHAALPAGVGKSPFPGACGAGHRLSGATAL